MLLKSCNKCGTLIPYGRAYCDRCAPIVEEARAERLEQSRKKSNRKYNRGRDPKYRAFYNSVAWRRLAAKRIQDDGYKCKLCGDWASEVDHIIPIQTPEGWERRLDYDNLQSLCHACHDKKHERFKRRKNDQTVAKTL